MLNFLIFCFWAAVVITVGMFMLQVVYYILVIVIMTLVAFFEWLFG